MKLIVGLYDRGLIDGLNLLRFRKFTKMVLTNPTYVQV